MFKRSFVAALVLSLAAAVAFPSASAAEPEQEWGVPIVAVDWSSLRLWPGAASVRIIKSFDETITLGHDTYPHRSQILEYVIACADRTFALKDWVLTDGAN